MYMIQILTSLALTLMFFVSAAQAQNVEIDGRIWRQPSETQGFSWDQIAAACPAGGGACTGTLGGQSLVGWTWATRTEVEELFEHYNPAWPGGPTVVSEADSAWAPAAEADFNNTNTTGAVWVVEGWMATGSNPFGDFGYIFNIASPAGEDEMRTGPRPRSAITPNSGVWLYQEAAADVPIGGAAYLLLGCLGAGALGARRRRRSASL